MGITVLDEHMEVDMLKCWICFFKLSSSGVVIFCCIGLCHCLICAVEFGAYLHELHRLYIGLQSDKFKNVHIADDEAHHPDSLETICPTRWLTRLSVVIWNKLPAELDLCLSCR